MVSYTDPDVIAERYHLAPDLAANLTGIGALAAAVIEP